MPIYIHNKRTFKGTGKYIGRPTLLGNPYSHMSDTKAMYRTDSRDEAVEMYGAYIRQQLYVEKNQQIRNEFDQMYAEYQRTGELHLVCWCAPHKCHGEVIRDILLNKAKERGELK